MRTIFTRARWIAAGLMLGAVAVLYAQEPARFERGIEVLRGNVLLSGSSGNQYCMEGSTADAFETCFTVTDPTADRTFTFGNANNTVVSWTLTTPTITGATISASPYTELSEIVTAANVLASSECGSTFYLSAVAGFLTTLPAPSLGCSFKLVVLTAPTSNGYTIGTPTANIIDGMVVERAGGAGVACADEDLLTLVANQSISGDWLEIRSDGTNWFVHGMTDVAAGFTCTVT